MKVGLDAFTIREITTDPIKQLEFARDNGFDGVQFDEASYLGTDPARLDEINSFAKEHGLYTAVSVDVVNPLFHKISVDANVKMIEDEIIAYAGAGWHELRTRTGGLDERGPEHRQAALDVMKLLKPVLLDNGSRINFENHGDCTTFEILQMIEEIGPEVMGINLDTANTMALGEDPILAAKRTAPYVHSTHAKDGILYFTQNGMTRQGKPAGQGIIDWDELLPILSEYTPDLILSIEDHKWLFEVQIYNEAWVQDFPDLNPYELGQLVKKTYECTQKIFKGEMPDPDEYEKIPFTDQLTERLTCAREHLKGCVAKL